jgi:hypothetical protein
MEGAKRAYRFHGTPYGQYVPKLEPPTHCDWCTLPFEEGMLKVPDRKFPLIKETNWKPGHFAFSERIGWFHEICKVMRQVVIFSQSREDTHPHP